mmetsp:Transcript_46961/g.130800  ORF Transcript_46961/g.130800 Transcript_46961/m.130800 type:complete len:272 (-) Transcript_46961:281-1096(-)
MNADLVAESGILSFRLSSFVKVMRVDFEHGTTRSDCLHRPSSPKTHTPSTKPTRSPHEPFSSPVRGNDRTYIVLHPELPLPMNALYFIRGISAKSLIVLSHQASYEWLLLAISWNLVSNASRYPSPLGSKPNAVHTSRPGYRCRSAQMSPSSSWQPAWQTSCTSVTAVAERPWKPPFFPSTAIQSCSAPFIPSLTKFTSDVPAREDSRDGEPPEMSAAAIAMQSLKMLRTSCLLFLHSKRAPPSGPGTQSVPRWGPSHSAKLAITAASFFK